MIYFTHRILDDLSCKELREQLFLSSDWQDGTYTATGKAKEIKRNIELKTDGQAYGKSSKEIKEAIKSSAHINNFAFPSKIFGLVFTRTGVGMYYGPHVDIAYVPDGRRDLSFTIFLNQPDEYKGGELVLNIPPERKVIKMKAGEMVIYPTKYLHEVKEVTKGERVVCVGWIESQIPRDDDRESLSWMIAGISEVIKNHGNSSATQTLNIAYNSIYKRFLS